MDLILIVVLIGLMMFAAIFGFLFWAGGRQNRIKKFLEEPKPKGKGKGLEWSDLWQYIEQVFKPLGEMLPRSPEEMSRQEQRLWQAGFRRKDGPALFYGGKIGLAILLLLLFTATGYLQTQPFSYGVLAIFIGAFLPDFWLSRRIEARKEKLQLGLPDILDLTVICVEAGLSLDQSIVRVSEEIYNSHPDLCDELRILNLEVRAGQRRAVALRHLAERTEVDDLRSLVTVLIQADRFGTSVARALRVFSDTFRTRQRQRAEERAAKMTVKMIPALIFFILPALLVVVMGPAVLTAMREILPKMSGN